MSKSKGNVVNPDDIIAKHGVDALRMYELFVGPPEDDAEWNTNGLEGVSRFLARMYRFFISHLGDNASSRPELERLRHRFVANLTERLTSFRLNTAVSSFMEYLNALQDVTAGIDEATLTTLAITISPFAPHMGEELWAQLGHETSVFTATWPTYEERWLADEEMEIAIQVNGRIRARLTVAADISEDSAVAAAQAHAELAPWLNGKTLVKSVYVPGRLINLVVKD
jgi:leucyl-tRNA synthetase